MLTPDFYFRRITDTTPQFFEENGIHALLLDADGTLTPDGVKVLSDDVLKWMTEVRAAGIGMALVSNNGEERVRPFADRYGLPYVSKAGKPSARCADEAVRAAGAPRSQTAAVGDQFFTDVLFAKNAGIMSILVDPMAADIYPFVKFKRFFERPLRRRVHRKGPGRQKRSR